MSSSNMRLKASISSRKPLKLLSNWTTLQRPSAVLHKHFMYFPASLLASKHTLRHLWKLLVYPVDRHIDKLPWCKCETNLTQLTPSLRVYSHLSCLVRLNQTQVCFPSWSGSFGQVWIQKSQSGADQTTVPRPSWRGGLSPLPNKLWYGSFKV